MKNYGQNEFFIEFAFALLNKIGTILFIKIGHIANILDRNFLKHA